MKSILIVLLTLFILVPGAYAQTVIYHPMPNTYSGFVYTPPTTYNPPIDWQYWRPYVHTIQPSGPSPVIILHPNGDIDLGVSMDAWTVVMED